MFFTTYLKGRFWVVVFFVAVIYFIVLIRSDLVQNDDLKKEKAILNQDLENASVRQAELKVRINSLKKNSYIEKLARERLGAIERGETPYKVIIK